MNEPNTTAPIVTRRGDGARFEITSQARSPTGTVDLRGLAYPHERIATRNDRLAVDFDDPRIPSPAELIGATEDDHAQRVRNATRHIVNSLRAAPTKPVDIRDECAVIADVAAAMGAAGWECSIEKGGARDNGKTDGLTVRAP